MLELDLLLGRFWEKHADDLTEEDLDALEIILENQEADLLDLVTGRKTCSEPRLQSVLSRLQAS